MALLLLDSRREAQLKAERQASGADCWDEVWEGVYVMPPMPNDEHQQVTTRLGVVYGLVVDFPGLGEVRVGVNVSDREEGWEHNYRIPDVAVFLRTGQAVNCGTHWRGGPDFLTEILSPDDRTLDKMPFYERIGVREALLVHRDPWMLELYQRRADQLVSLGQSTLAKPAWLDSIVLPLRFRLAPGTDRPRIEIHHRDGQQQWSV